MSGIPFSRMLRTWRNGNGAQSQAKVTLIDWAKKEAKGRRQKEWGQNKNWDRTKIGTEQKWRQNENGDRIRLAKTFTKRKVSANVN